MQNLVLLHGAIGSKDQLIPLSELLNEDFNIYSFNFYGHGGSSYTSDQFSISQFSQELLKFIDDHKIQQPSIFGYSMGGYIALYTAKRHPSRFKRIITLATKFQWDPAIAEKEIRMLDADKIEQKVPAFAEQLKHRHSPNDWKELLNRTKTLLVNLGNKNELSEEDYAAIVTPVLILLGDRDKMIGFDESIKVYQAIPGAQFGVIPDSGHPIESVDITILGSLIKNFLEKLS